MHFSGFAILKIQMDHADDWKIVSPAPSIIAFSIGKKTAHVRSRREFL